MNISGKDLKLLWGRSGNRCAVCRIPLTQDSSAVTAAFTLGEQAHIVGEKEDAPRGRSLMTLAERNSYHNLILLCPNHHTEIDKNENDWPVEKLHLTKSRHELWVTETLSETIDHVSLAHQAVVSAIVDSAVENCDLDNWKNWTGLALAPNQLWSKDRPDKIMAFRQQIISAVWPPGFEELRRSATTLSVLLQRAASTFLDHAVPAGNSFVTDRFYKRPSFNPTYEEDLQRFNNWQENCYDLLRQATKAANWFAEVVRRDINPMFFATKGKFLIEEGPFFDLSYQTRLLEFTESEKKNLPDSLF